MNSKKMLVNQEIEVINMSKIATVTLTVLLLLTMKKVSASAIERNEPSRNLQSVEKTFSVGNEKRGLRATIMTKDSVVEVVHVGEKMQQGSSEGFTNIVARVYIHTIIPDTYDFALSRSGRILWLVVPIEMDGLPSGGRFHAIYPLLRDDATNQYDFMSKQRTIIEDRYGIVRNAISLTGLIRDVSRSMRAKGDSITVKQERMLTDLHIACPEGESAIVSGKLGAEYSFTVEIGLGEDCRFWAKNCEVIHINEQEDPVK